MPTVKRGSWKAAGFTAFIFLLVALAIGSVNFVQFIIYFSAVVLNVVYLHSVFPGSRFFSISVANFIALYTCLFSFFVTANFSFVSGELLSIGYFMPILGFFTSIWVNRKNIKSVVVEHHKNAKGLTVGSVRWLLPISLIGVATFFVPENAVPVLWGDIIFLVSMGCITLVVSVVSKDVATFLLEAGLLFEAFFLRIEMLVMPAFAFLTFYSMNVMVFGFLYRIIDHYSTVTHFSIQGEVRAISFIESLYFSIITLSTVGYGDIIPVTDGIKAVVSIQIVVSVMLLLFGFSEIMSYSRSRPGKRDRT
ncbi:ion channel [Kiloniella litopenaei]|uniref:ion channel n=1 Tax=Kiloniella litopenaei TaxID=1549748 RepID=UPI003BADA648